MTNFEGGTMLRVIKALDYVIPCCIVMLAFAGCGAKNPVAPGAPAATTLDKLSSSAYEISNALDGGETEFEALYTSNLPGVSDDGYAKTVAQMFLSAQSCAGSYISELKSLVAVDDSNKAQVTGWSSALVSCVNNLVGSGVAGIKNPDARKKIQDLLAPIPAAIKLIVDAMGLSVSTFMRPCEGACAAFIFTEVNDGHGNRSRTYRAGNSVGGEPARIFYAPQASKRSYRSATLGRCRQDQRRGCDQDSGVPFAAQRRGITNPIREAWLYS
jgi:hypothetical protein